MAKHTKRRSHKRRHKHSSGSKKGSLVSIGGKKFRCYKKRVSAFGKRKKVTRAFCGNPKKK